MKTARHEPGFIAVEPDQARDMVINLVQHGVQFCCEIDPSLRGMKDCIVLSRSATLEHRPGWEHVSQRATTLDDAIHFALNLLKTELTFQCNPETRPNDPLAREWRFSVEVRGEGRTGA